MNLRFDKCGIKFHIGINRTARVKGVNSKLADGKHFLMWDIDGVPKGKLVPALYKIQVRFALPKIYVLDTGIEGYYHAYCFKRFAWADVLHILASTEYLDKIYLSIGVLRGYWTLRISDKRNRPIQPAFVLESHFKEDVTPEDVLSFVEYSSKRR